MNMTLDGMKEILQQKNPETPLLFSTAAKTIGAGYHVTELKMSDITSIDCGGHISRWTEVALQLLDGEHGEFMKVGKFLSILKHSFAEVRGLNSSPVFVEFSPQNEGLGKYELTYMDAGPDNAEFLLKDVQAQCKPSLSGTGRSAEPAVAPTVAPSCCGGPAPQGVDACCVKDADAKASGELGCGCGKAKQAPDSNSARSCCA